MKRLSVNLPLYRVDHEPDIGAVSATLDNIIKREFFGKTVVARGVASSAHPGKTADEIVDIIAKRGTDRYDPSRTGDRYENVENKHIDLFGVLARVSQQSEITQTIIWGFYHSARAVHGHPVKIDIITIYDADQLGQVLHRYEGRNDTKDDGFVFKYPEHKTKAVLGIIRIT